MPSQSGATKETPHFLSGPLSSDCFRQGPSYQTHRSRGTSDWLLMFTLAGSGHVGTREHTFPTAPGDVVLYEPRTFQRYGTNPSAGRWHFLYAHFYARPHWKDWLKWPQKDKGLCLVSLHDPASRRAMQKALEECVQWQRQRQAGAMDFALNALERALLCASTTAQGGSRDERIRRAADILAAEINRPLYLPDLAARCGLSLSRFAHLFRAEMGVSPQFYHESIRLERAAQMLRFTSLPIAQIAEESGYASAFYFSNRFKKAFQQSPSSYRRNIVQN